MDDRTWWIETRTEEARAIIGRVGPATRLSARLSALHYDEPDEIRKANKCKYIGLSECSAATLRKANTSMSIEPASFIFEYHG